MCVNNQVNSVSIDSNYLFHLLPGSMVEKKIRILDSHFPELIFDTKTVSTKKINILRDAPATPLWQRNYYEHIIRDRNAIDQLHPVEPPIGITEGFPYRLDSRLKSFCLLAVLSKLNLIYQSRHHYNF